MPAPPAGAQFLYDATKAEMAGNADWVVDADAHNLNVTNGSGSGTVNTGGTDSNPKQFPSPSFTGVSASTTETYWQGGLSAMGVALAKRGFSPETLPFTGLITYGNAANAQDLSHYKVFAIVEPNIVFTTSEQTALVSFVQNGGGLLMVADHGGSDRNNDGADSCRVWNDLFSAKGNPFGITFNANDVSPDATGTAVDAAAGDPLTNGAAGAVSEFKFSAGSTITIDATKNASVKSAVWTTATHTNSNIMAAYATFGRGRVVAIGDSSPFDDGTGDPGDMLYDGWDDAGGSNGRLVTNASIWLASSVTPAPEPSGLVGLAVGAGGLALLAFARRRRTVERELQ